MLFRFIRDVYISLYVMTWSYWSQSNTKFIKWIRKSPFLSFFWKNFHWIGIISLCMCDIIQQGINEVEILLVGKLQIMNSVFVIDLGLIKFSIFHYCQFY